MTLKRTTWTPDTCTCRVTYEWDDQVEASARIHSPTSVEYKCPAHQGAAGNPVSLVPILWEENRRKGNAITIAGSELGMSPNNLDLSAFSWFFSANRVLELSFVGIEVPQATKSKIQKACNAQFGAGKVSIQ